MDTDQIWSRIELVDKIKFTNEWNSIVRQNSNFRVHIIHFCQKVIVLPKTGILSKTQFWIKIHFSPKKVGFLFSNFGLFRANKQDRNLLNFWIKQKILIVPDIVVIFNLMGSLWFLKKGKIFEFCKARVF